MRRNHATVTLPIAICLLSVGGLVAAPHTVLLSVIRGADGRPVPCGEDPVCHNRIHSGIPPTAFANPGDVVVFETRDAVDNQLDSTSTAADVGSLDAGRVHPLTGPLFVNGAEPGDLLEVTIQGVEPAPDRFGWTLATPALGFLRDLIPGPALARWDLRPEGAVSPDLPGVRIPEAGFPGVVTTAPGPALLGEILSREFEALFAGGMALPPDPSGAVPEAVCGASSPAAMQCLRTLPAREHGGNFDVKAIRPGVRLLLPCYVEGCLLSIGDVHYAQGDGEVSGSAIEMNAVVRVGIRLRQGQATVLGDRPAFESGPPFGGSPPAERPNRPFYATMGFPLKAVSEIIPQHRGLPFPPGPLSYINHAAMAPLRNLPEDLTLAARDALRQMVRYLTSARGLTEEQAYLLASVAVDLRIGNVVDVPNVTVYAMLPLDVFTFPREPPER
jgi:formamidase